MPEEQKLTDRIDAHLRCTDDFRRQRKTYRLLAEASDALKAADDPALVHVPFTKVGAIRASVFRPA